jgi:hypothetical protein
VRSGSRSAYQLGVVLGRLRNRSAYRFVWWQLVQSCATYKRFQSSMIASTTPHSAPINFTMASNVSNMIIFPSTRVTHVGLADREATTPLHGGKALRDDEPRWISKRLTNVPNSKNLSRLGRNGFGKRIQNHFNGSFPEVFFRTPLRGSNSVRLPFFIFGREFHDFWSGSPIRPNPYFQ